jgi:hypothetical protein
MDQVDVAADGLCEPSEVVMVGRHDLIAVFGEQHNSGVDHVGKTSYCQEPAGSATQQLIKSSNVDSVERLGEASLAWPTTPHLSEYASMGTRDIAFELGTLEANPHGALVALERDERCAVEHQAHAVFEFREAGAR